jgi:hydroxylamine reductase (hybrid-cluster protein)
MRTVSCADAGKTMQIKAKLAANMRCTVPDIAISWVRQRVERRYPATPAIFGYS